MIFVEPESSSVGVFVKGGCETRLWNEHVTLPLPICEYFLKTHDRMETTTFFFKPTAVQKLAGVEEILLTDSSADNLI